ncbi:MAG: amino acid adenylation domain-containing protein [Lachnospiraceae bacterium]|nr:amino acid adenylation domain-containing protein [Lachnospiraceae bacterium]
MVKSVLDYLEKSLCLYPDKLAVVHGEESYTYRELTQKVKAMGSYLVSKGLTVNAPVVVLLDKELRALPTFWGITYGGGIYVPLDAHAPVNRLKLIMEVLQPAFVITNETFLDKAQELADSEQIIMVDAAFEQEINEAALAEIRKQQIDTDPVYIICTSGSTGVPKGVVISHRAVIDFTEEASEVMEFSEKEVFANQAPFYFDASVPDLYCTIRNGATLHIIPQNMFSFPIRVLEYIKEHGVNAIYWVPSALIVAANLRALGEVDISGLKKVMFCGEVMPTKQLNMWKKHLPDAKYVNYYGPSETTYASTYYVIDREFSNDEPLPIGKPAINTGVLILNDENKLAAPGEIGELCIKGSGVALGYYNNPEKTKEAFVQNPVNTKYPEIIYRTGDLVRENERGELEYVCRKDFQIKHMGYRIELGEIEHAAMSLEAMKRVCCLYNQRKQNIVLIYEGDVEAAEVKAEVKNRVPEYMVPGIIHKLEKMPMNANGKIDRVLLKEQYGQ